MATETVPNIVRGHVPYDDAHACNHLLTEALTLVHAVGATIGDEGDKCTDCEITSVNSRVHQLLFMAREKLTEAVNKLAI